MTTASNCLQGFGYLLISVVTASANIPLAIFLARSGKAREDVVSTAMLSLTVSDLCLGTVVTAASAVFAWIQPTVVVNAALVVQGSLWHACTICSICHLALMSALKCFIIVRPMTYAGVLTDRFRTVVIVLIWIGTFVVVLGANIAGARWMMDRYVYLAALVPNRDVSIGLRFLETCVIFAASSIVMIISYVKIFFVVRQHHLRLGQLDAISTSAAQRTQNQGWTASIRSARSLFVVCIAFYLCYIPANVNNIGFALPYWFLIASRWIILSSALINSLLYVVCNRSTRREFGKMFFGKWLRTFGVSPDIIT